MAAEEPGNAFDTTLLLHGTQIRQMLAYSDWVNRRVEQISFIDDQTVRRRVSIDFKLPPGYAELQTLTQWFAPLALLRKKHPLAGFDLFDEEGRALPLVASREGRRIALGTLINLASTVVAQAGGSLTPDLNDSLKRLVDCPAPEAERALREVLEPRTGLDVRNHLANNPEMTRLAKDLAQNFLVLVPIDDPGKRRVIKFSYLEKVLLKDHGLASSLGWKPFSFSFPTVGPSMAHSYHCELSAPENFEIAEAKLSAVPSSGNENSVSIPLDTERMGRYGEYRVHLQMREQPPDASGLLKVALRPRSPGLPGASAMLALGVSLLLTAGIVFHDRVAGSGESATALLIAVPALISVYVARPAHQLSRRLLRGVGRLAGGVGLLAFLAAAATVLADPSCCNGSGAASAGSDEIVLMTWLPLAALAWLATLVLSLSLFLPYADPRPLSSK